MNSRERFQAVMDHAVATDLPFENHAHYRKLLREMAESPGGGR